jgi:hypothetical protein
VSIVGAAWVMYGAMAMLSVRPFAGHFAWAMFQSYRINYPALARGRTSPEGAHWFGGLLLGVLVAAVWPLALLFILVGWRGPVIGAEKAARLDAAQRRINELERELQIKSREWSA